MDNLFMQATRKAWRFETNKGELSVEQVWQLPLTSRSGCDLDTIARGINTEIKSLGEESFVAIKPNPKLAEFQAKLELIKAIIAVKQEEQALAAKRVERGEQRRKLLEALAKKEDEALSNASREDLLKKLAEIDAD